MGLLLKTKATIATGAHRTLGARPVTDAMRNRPSRPAASTIPNAVITWLITSLRVVMTGTKQTGMDAITTVRRQLRQAVLDRKLR